MSVKIEIGSLFEEAKRREDYSLSDNQKNNLKRIVEISCGGKNKAVLAVTCTLMYKKIIDPNQDIRLHQANMPDGFSGRGLDTKIVTPFLRSENFPYMASGTGWLTRSFEQSKPYYKNYDGGISPPDIKTAFLNIIDEIESGLDARECLQFIFSNLLEWRQNNASLNLAKPSNLMIEEIVNLVEEHWKSGLNGSAKLPVLSIFAAYTCLVEEVKKYKNCELLDLLSHTSADTKSKRLGDIDVINLDDTPFESVEIKHNIKITQQLVSGLREKIAGSGTKTFYILSTDENINSEELAAINDQIVEMKKKYGCQVIVNGVTKSLKYYLRLIDNTSKFISIYVELLEDDDEITFDLMHKWNELVG